MKKLYWILPLGLILCFAVACQDKEAMAELEVFRAQAALEEQNETLYREFIDELNKGNLDVFDEYFAPDYAYYFPSNTQNPLSLEETRELVVTHLKSFPDYNWKIEELYAVKDMIIARMSTSGTFKEEYRGLPRSSPGMFAYSYLRPFLESIIFIFFSKNFYRIFPISIIHL